MSESKAENVHQLSLAISFENRSIQATVDLNSSYSSLLKYICGQLFKLPSPDNFALRVGETEELVTEENYRRRLRVAKSLKVVSAPTVEARELFEKLGTTEEKSLKLAVFSIQKNLKDVEFVDEFLLLGGLNSLTKIIGSSNGNVLAYALNSLLSIMQHEYGWENIQPEFVQTLVNIIVEQNLVNICRPATSILIKLVCADSTAKSAVQCYGFNFVYSAILDAPNFFNVLVHRLSAADYLLQKNSLTLMNGLLDHVTDAHRFDLLDKLEELRVKKAVMSMMQSNSDGEILKHLLEFQRLIIRDLNRKKRSNPLNYPKQKEMLEFIWTAASIPGSMSPDWFMIGFDTETPIKELQRVGLLGFLCMHSFVDRNRDFYAKSILEQVSRQPERRCPFAKVCFEVIELLCDYWDINVGYTTNTVVQPLLLAFDSVHDITVKAFFRMWTEMKATITDFAKVSALVRSQIFFTLRDEPKIYLYQFEQSMLEVPYHVVRERQLKELEQEDDLLSKLAVRNLRERLYKESYQFVKEQRISCLSNGAWFNSAPVKTKGKPTYRFYKLSPNRKYLHYAEFSDILPNKLSLEQLPEKVDLSLVTSIVTGSAASSLNRKPASSLTNPTSGVSGIYNFSLMYGPDITLAEFYTPIETLFSEWTDGLNMLFDKNIANKDTAELIQSLTELELKVHLLDITAEQVELPSYCEIPELPSNFDFYYRDASNEGGSIMN
ncbi:hypothetical protein K493DRAFT_103700 [Basidiobolus meristosporus CBS 931.73]|uniref:ELMO domain-containing protein n=1 Tax=Basidiobolus meristosporus CBS 931.73 TaxID=1314790 RepID=A0A1Y1YRI9_9FUNG|nr:hypothetical protein K493DRAFT_103700 [Basidiobolus meristosporus CBS 931.73]|eukprot:ORY00434.1 hypothetical protein K493DRAFT_103700 [Basidiobolus meristosporus CBS 931.73]